MGVGWGWVLRLFAEGALAGQLKVNVFKLVALHTEDALAGQLMLKWVPASVVPGLCAQWHPAGHLKLKWL